MLGDEALLHGGVVGQPSSGHAGVAQGEDSVASQAGVSLYAASKFGVRALTEALIEEYRHSNVRVTSVSPGPVDTTIWTHKIEPPSAERRAKMLRASDISDMLV